MQQPVPAATQGNNGTPAATNMDAKREQYIDERSDAFFKEWLARISAWGAVLFLMIGALDYAIFPQYFPLFLRYRIIIALVLIGTSVLVRRNYGRPLSFHNTLAYLAVIGSASAIELMIMRTGGHSSPYYTGMIVLAICVIGFVPADFLMSATSTLLIYCIYVLPIIATDRITDSGTFITANAFISASLLSMLLLRLLSQRSLRNEWGLQYDLDQQHGWLEEQVHERTVQLLNTIEDLEKQIAERQRAEAALVKSEERFRTLAENASDMIYRMSLPDGQYEYVSPASKQLFGYSPEEFYARPLEIQRLVHPDWRGLFQGAVEQAAGRRHAAVL
jgi:PAS domain-containing protein